MSALVGAWLAACSLVWLALVAGVGSWGARWRLAPGLPSGRVRVCVPARDEAGRVGACVAAVRRSEGVALEVVVADDGSTDETADEARRAGAEVVTVPPRPDGWAGKPWACNAAARGADTPWLLFLDADVQVHPGAIAAAVARAEADGADLLSLFGTWELGSFWERVAIPAIGWFVRGATDLDQVNAGAEAFANGQLLLVRREAWLAWGTHTAVKDAVLDDVGLARVARARGATLRLLYAPWAFRVRLYRGLGEITAGYRKNFYAGMGDRPGVALAAAAGVLLTTVLPPLAVPLLASWRPGLAIWAAAVALAAMIFRWRVERLDGRSGAVAPLHALGAAVLVWVILASMTGAEVRWKGRAFRGGRAVPDARDGAGQP